MPAWDIHRTVNSARILTDLAVERGLSEAKALAGTGISHSQLHLPDTMVEARQELRLIANIVKGLGHLPALGVQAGMRYHFNAFGALGFALVSSRTLQDAIETGLKYVQLTFAFSALELRVTPDQTHVYFDPDGVPDPVKQFVVERDSACLATLQRDIFNSVSPLVGLHFAFDAPDDLAPYEAFYGVTPRFAMARNAMILNTAQLQQPLPQASDLARTMAESQCEALLNQRLQRAGLAARVRQFLASNARNMPDMEAAARAMNTIPRTLRRRLLQERTSFAELRDEVRQTLAEEYLSGPRLSVEQVAERLGYSGATSFINAYKRWYGVTPSAGRSRRPPDHDSGY